ncbi:MAG: methyltransferase [Microthrixaceae bacterium]
MEQLNAPQGKFDLERYPRRSNDRLRAWDAADELVLEYLAGEFAVPADEDGPTAPTVAGAVDLSGTTVVVNDSFGALAVALSASMSTGRLVSYGDSFISHRGTEENLSNNGLEVSSVERVGSLGDLPERIDTLVVKLPRSNDLLIDQLARLAPHVHAETVVVGAAMTKHVHRSGLEAFESTIGPTRTSLAKKKARLIVASPDAGVVPPEPVGPRTFVLDPGNLRVKSHPGVFAPERLDIGTSLFLDNLPDQAGQIRIIDLGCGNGVVGLVALVDNPDAELIFVDESYFAVASAEATIRENLGGSTGAEFVVGSGLDDLQGHGPIERGSVDLIFNNPPFHVDHALSDSTAWQMFSESHAALRKGGQLWVIGNRHLAYHAKLKRIFGNCDVIDSSPKFVVYRSTRT